MGNSKRILYALLFIVLSLPLLFKWSFPPMRMGQADKFFERLEQTNFDDNKIVLLALDFGPGSKAENETQSRLVIEHLFRKRIPFAVFSQYEQAESFLSSIPESVAELLESQGSGEKWQYGIDWVNLGLRPNGAIVLQSIATSDDIGETLKRDAKGSSLRGLPIFNGVKTLRDLPLVIQITSLNAVFELYVQFLVRDGYRPTLLHACTSISIPRAYNFIDANLLYAVLEGAAGAAWYSKRMSEVYRSRAEDNSIAINTGLGFAVAFVVLVIIFSNLELVVSRLKGRG